MQLLSRHRLPALLTFLLWFVLFSFGTPDLRAAPAATDVLVFKDGDRVVGRLVAIEDGRTIVFRSNRFGELRVPVAQADVIAGGAIAAAPPPVAPPALGAPSAPASSPNGDKPDAALAAQRLSILRLSSELRRIFGPWHGRLAFSSAIVNDTTDRQNEVLEGRMERKWVGDEVRLDTRYEFSTTDQKTNTDTTKGGAYWRHDVSNRWFTIVHPTVEWNRNYIDQGRQADYFLLQNELGGGLTLWDRPGRKLRAGLSENLYDVWNISSSSHQARNIESAFVEAEFRLPWDVRLTERGIRYFALRGGNTGWENQFELSKKFSENLVLALRHEIRRKETAIRVQDFSAWHLLLGLDF